MGMHNIHNTTLPTQIASLGKAKRINSTRLNGSLPQHVRTPAIYPQEPTF